MDTARHEWGIRIPDDLSIVGFDDIPLAGWPAYNLTTIRQPIVEMVEATLKLLERDREEAQNSQVKLLPVELMVRGSARTSAIR